MTYNVFSGTLNPAQSINTAPQLLISTSGRQPKIAALNRGRHLYSAGRPSRWALAHISSFYFSASSIICREQRQ